MYKKFQVSQCNNQRGRLLTLLFCAMSALLYIMPGSALATTDNILPTGCTPITISSESANLPLKKKPVLILIHNLTQTDLWLTHPVTEPSASAGWNSRIEKSKWSAFLLDSPSLHGSSFEFQCVESKPGHEQQISCAEAISLCRLSVKMPPQKDLGSFWAGENLSLKELMAHLGRRGFELLDNNLEK